MTPNEELYKKTLEAIFELYSDTNVSKAKCRENLQGLIDEIGFMIESLGKIE